MNQNPFVDRCLLPDATADRIRLFWSRIYQAMPEQQKAYAILILRTLQNCPQDILEKTHV